MSECVACGVNRTTSSSGTADLSLCKCNAGYYIDPITNECIPCADGLICNQLGLSIVNITYANDYYGQQDPSTGLLIVTRCPVR